MNLQPLTRHFPKFLRNITEYLTVDLWHHYIEFVAKTSKVTIRGLEEIKENRMIGFWHEDSYNMQLVLREIQKKGIAANVIVTKERRGDYIADMIRRYGAKPVRLPNGMEMRPFMRELTQKSKEEGMLLAAAMDGPSGPYHKPKRLLFLLAHEADKEFVSVAFQRKGMLWIPWRWDKYRLPLPFSRIVCEVKYWGRVEQSNLREFHTYIAQNLGEFIDEDQK